MSDKLNLSDITNYIKSLINFNQIKTPKALQTACSGSMVLVLGSWLSNRFVLN